MLEPLRDLLHLRSLKICDQRNMLDLAPLADLRSLERLGLSSCGATLALPSFATCTKLKVLVVDKLATPANLHLIAAAPALRCLVLSGSPALHNVVAFGALADHPTLREVRIESFDDDL